MVHISGKDLIPLLKNTKDIRNFCILAHIDHGKTTLSDFLISSNGVISPMLAGQMRYMDSREDEQQKQITMKSSSIALLFSRYAKHQQLAENLQPPQKQKPKIEKYLMNLIDSPGHVDFSSEVSAATRLSDGCLLLVDVVQGVCTQTRSVITQCFKENITPCLVLNKMDRLVTELKMTPLEAYRQLYKILEQVNAIFLSLKTKTMIEKSESVAIETDDLDSSHFFSPLKGNVAFGSAIDGWAFRIHDFFDIFAEKFGMEKEVLANSLWGEFYYSKTGVKTQPFGNNNEPMFVQFILRNVFEVYNISHSDLTKPENFEKLRKMMKTFDFTDEEIDRVAEILLKKGSITPKKLSKMLMMKWMPMSSSLLSMVAEQLPSPIDAQRKRYLDLIPDLDNKQMKEVFKKNNIALDQKEKEDKEQDKQKEKEDTEEEKQKDKEDKEEATKNTKIDKQNMRGLRKKLKKDLLQCNTSEDAETMVYLAKMLRMDALVLPNTRTSTPSSTDTAGATTAINNQTMEETDAYANAKKQELIGFARIFSGTIRVGQKLHILLPRYNPFRPDKHHFEFTVTNLYLLLGRDMEPVSEVPAGNIFGIGGPSISANILKTATITSSPYSPIFASMYFLAAPIVKIAVEAVSMSDMPKLIKGLKELNQSDPSVEIFVQETGEHVIMTAGEVHAERCLNDLKRFTGIELEQSPPLFSFRETIIGLKKKAIETNNVISSPKIISSTVSAPLPKSKPMKIKPTAEENEQVPDFHEIPKEGKKLIIISSKKKEQESAIPIGGVVGKDFSNDEKMEIFHNLNITQAKAKKIKKEEQDEENEPKSDNESENEEDKEKQSKKASKSSPNPQSSEPKQKKIKTNIAKVLILNKKCSITIKALPLPKNITDFIEANKESIRKSTGKFANAEFVSMQALQDLKTVFAAAGPAWEKEWDNLWCLGPKRFGPNILLNHIPAFKKPNFKQLLERIISRTHNEQILNEEKPENDENKLFCDIISALDVSIQGGFQLATHSGPMCAEPMYGVCFSIEDITFDYEGCTTATSFIEKLSKQTSGTFGGQIMSGFKDCCHEAFDGCSKRLVEAMYRCEIQSPHNTVGSAYAVLRKRRARTASEECEEGTGLFLILCYLPVVESFGFSTELRTKTSGLAQPQLMFSHWEVVDVDPFYIPTTDEEIEEFGELTEEDMRKAPNIARDFIQNIRSRKGLSTTKKIVEHAEKQRTLSKKK